MPPPPPSSLSGFIVIDKPVGGSSMRAVSIVRRAAGGVRTGHAGTLDPLAEGILIIALGAATKSLDTFVSLSKRYRTRIDLSAFTATDDREGAREEVHVERPPAREAVEAALRVLTGEILQTPPAFSAVKIGGKRAYRMARRGDAVAMPSRRVTVHSIEVVQYDWPLVEIDVHCGKGTYIRSIARALGRSLGTGGHCVTLRRTAIGPFDESMAIPLDRLPRPLEQSHLMAVDAAIARVTGPATRSTT
jgi:tRNA pseudouridine55 synthase